VPFWVVSQVEELHPSMDEFTKKPPIQSLEGSTPVSKW